VRGSFFFGGDTGYCSIFKSVGEEFPNGITLAALPIGAYGSENEHWLHKPNHLNPSEAVQTHLDLNAKYSMGIHWGTFLVTGEPIMEPVALLEEAKKVRLW
jgi:N-acyl-phosphatidylethanolamine-hydrolysing phospholipase D